MSQKFNNKQNVIFFKNIPRNSFLKVIIYWHDLKNETLYVMSLMQVTVSSVIKQKG